MERNEHKTDDRAESSADRASHVRIAAEIGFACLSLLKITPEGAAEMGKDQALKKLEQNLQTHHIEHPSAVHIEHIEHATITHGVPIDIEQLMRLIRRQPELSERPRE
jgi:hypothetical protein